MAGIFQHLGGSSADTDRGQQLKSYGELGNVFNWAMPFGQGQAQAGQSTTSQGLQNLAQAGSYFGKLASGNRPAALQAIAPQANAALAQNDAQKQQLSEMGTARGGGTAGLNQQRDTQLMSQIDNMLFGAQAGGAQRLAGIGESQSGIGLGQTGQGLQSAGLASSSAGTLGQLAHYNRAQSNEIHRQAVSDLTSAAEDIMSSFGLDIPV